MTRLRLTNSERSDQVAFDVARAIDRAPMNDRAALEVLVSRIITTRDDLHQRTGGKQQTFALTRTIKNGKGEVIRTEDLSEDQRRKSVAATLGAMLVARKRNTRTWVLDAVDEALSYLPWSWR